MYRTIEKLERERSDLIEIITVITRQERFHSDDFEDIGRHIAAHMTRLSALDAELAEARTLREIV